MSSYILACLLPAALLSAGCGSPAPLQEDTPGEAVSADPQALRCAAVPICPQGRAARGCRCVEPRVVELQMAFGVVIGEFAGLEPDGSLRVKVGAATLVIGSHRVDRLREIRPGNRGQLPGVGPIVDWNQWVAA